MHMNLNKEEKDIIKSILLLFILGTITHYLYEFTNKNCFVGLIAPINESVWEHLKLIVVPGILWWFSYYYINKNKINKNKWFMAALSSISISLILMPMIFYFYTEACGIQWIVIDILILLIVFTIGQLLALHVYRYSKGRNYIIPIIVLGLIIFIFMIFTVYPLKLPIFIEK